jgi:uncharacterized protein YdiU (UPF0061 family)
MRSKLGLFNAEDDDLKLAEDLLMYMQKNKADYTNTFRSLGKDAIKQMDMYNDAGFRNWLQQWQARLSRQTESIEQSIVLMDKTNPAIIPRNHLVEEALNAAVDSDDLQPLQKLLSAISRPHDPSEDERIFMQAPHTGFDSNYKTFCGT